MKLRLKAERPLIYLSGVGSSNLREKELYSMGCRYRCFSYAYTCPDAFYYSKRMKDALQTCLDQKVGVMMDSAAHSIHMLAQRGRKKRSGKWDVYDINKLRDMVVDQYSEYVLKEGKKWDWYVNFDYVRDYQIVYNMQKLLEKKGLDPVPVFHGDNDLKWLERYCKEGYKLIGIGSIKRPRFEDKRFYYDSVFNMLEKYGILAHGFAVTSISLMLQYPWYSVDSATWAKAAAYGSILYPDIARHTNGEFHITNRTIGGHTSYNQLPKGLQKDIKNEVEGNGFDFHKLQEDGAERSVYNVWVTCNKLHELKEAVSSVRSKWRSLLV